MIIPTKAAELMKNTAQGAIAATMRPPTVGPITRAMFPPRALRVRAAGSSDLGTSPLNVGMIGVLIIVRPAPNAQVTRSILRRSKMSENIPDGNANRKIGKAVAVVMRETNNGLGEREVINQD